MSRRLSLVVLVLILMSLGVSAARAQAGYSTPGQLLLAYYNAINVHNYQLAYSLRDNPTQTYQNFANGFADTLRGEPYIGDFQPASGSQSQGRVPVVLLAYKTNGALASFYGCFYVGWNGASWRITGANLKPLGSGIPDLPTTSAYLSVNCYNPVAPIQPTFMDMTTRPHPYLTLLYYYDNINAKQFNTAYGLWLQPLPGQQPNGAPPQDYRPNYQTFASGYADTAYVNLYLGNYSYGGAAAGKPYLDGTMPAVLVGQKTDGTVTAFYGCYVIGGLNGSPTGMGIVSGKFNTLANGVPSGSLIVQYLNANCAGLTLQY